MRGGRGLQRHLEFGRFIGRKPHVHGDVVLCERCGRVCDGRCRARELKEKDEAEAYRRATPLL